MWVTVTANTPEKKSLAVEVKSTDTVGDLKSHIKSFFNVEPSKQILVFKGTALDDSKILQAFGVVDGSHIELSTAAAAAVRQRSIFFRRPSITNKNEQAPPANTTIPLPVEIPSDTEVNRLFDALMESRGEKPEGIEKMRVSIPTSAKWALLTANRAKESAPAPKSAPKKTEVDMNDPKYWKRRLGEKPIPPDVLQRLRVILNDATPEWLDSFIAQVTMAPFCDMLQSGSELKSQALSCIKALFNRDAAKQMVTETPGGVEALASLLADPTALFLLAVCDLLTALCWQSNAREAVITALANKQIFPGCKFAVIMSHLRSVLLGVEEKCAVLALVNAIVQLANHLDTRVSIRQDFIDVGMLEVLVELRKWVASSMHSSSSSSQYGSLKKLEVQCDLFEQEMDIDAKESMAANVDLSNASALFNRLRVMTAMTGRSHDLMSVLQLLLTIPDHHCVDMWDNVKFAVALATNNKSLSQAVVEQKLRNRNGEGADQPLMSFSELSQILQSRKAGEYPDDSGSALSSPMKSPAPKTPQDMGSPVSPVPTPQELASGGAPPPPPPPGGLDGVIGGAPPPPPPPPMTDGFPPPPPPPGGLGVPPPPGPPGMPGAPPMLGGPMLNLAPAAPTAPKGMTLKQPVKPSVPMKALHWVPLSHNAVEKSLWVKLDDSKVDLEVSELETMFADNKPKGAKGKKEEEEKVEAIVPAVVTLVDPQKSQNINITLSKLKSSAMEVKRAILTVNENLLDDRIIDALFTNCVPTPEEIAVLNDYKGDLARLGKAEIFLMAVKSIPKLGDRLKCMAFKYRIQDMAGWVETCVKDCTVALDKLQKSKGVAALLQVVLALGNYLNGGTKKGCVYGFSLQSLARLSAIKSQDKKSNLLEYVVKTMMRVNPGVASIHLEFEDLTNAAKIEMTSLVKEVSELSGGVARIEEVLATEPVGSEDNFRKVFRPLVPPAKATVDRLRKDVDALQKQYKETCVLFGEDPEKSEMEWKETCPLINMFLVFILDYKMAFDSIESAREREENERKRKLAQDAMRATNLVRKGEVDSLANEEPAPTGSHRRAASRGHKAAPRNPSLGKKQSTKLAQVFSAANASTALVSPTQSTAPPPSATSTLTSSSSSSSLLKRFVKSPETSAATTTTTATSVASSASPAPAPAPPTQSKSRIPSLSSMKPPPTRDPPAKPSGIPTRVAEAGKGGTKSEIMDVAKGANVSQIGQAIRAHRMESAKRTNK